MVTKEEMKDIALVSGVCAVLGALSLGAYSTYLIVAFLCAYFVYSMPPLRLRRVPILSMFLISLACLTVTMLGFFLFSTDLHVDAFPRPLALLIILCFTLGANMKDLKDIEGDRAVGIMTIPTLFGEAWGRTIIGGMLFLSMMLVPVILSRPALFFPAVASAGALWVGVVRGKGERFIFGVYFVSVAVFLVMEFFVR
jgi:4-hydroxybenzoate polyprenyltransferase